MERITYQDIPNGMSDVLLKVEAIINASSLDFRLLELVRLRVAQKNGCAYCVDMHHKEAIHAGVSEPKLAAVMVWEEAECFSEKERIALKFADALTRLQRAELPGAIYDPLLDHFTKEEISHLTLCVAMSNLWNRLMKTFRFTPGQYQVRTAN